MTETTENAWTLERVAIIGGGYLGSRIAAELSLMGLPVKLFDKMGNASLEEIHSVLLSAKHLMPQEHAAMIIQKALVNIRITKTLEEAVHDASLVSEAVVDKVEIKKMVFAEIELHCPENCVLTTNSMTIALSELQKGMARPGHLMSLRWLAPVVFIPFVEVAVRDNDEEQAAVRHDIVSALASKLRKVVFECPDAVNAVQGDTQGAVNGYQRLRLQQREVTWHQQKVAKHRHYPEFNIAPEESQDDDTEACVVCLDQKREALLIGCGHKVMCRDCAARYCVSATSCPVCRAPIQSSPVTLAV